MRYPSVVFASVLAMFLALAGNAWAQAPVAPPALDQTGTAPDVPGSTHAGFKALVRDTGGDFKHTFTDFVPLMWLGLGGADALVVHPLDDNVNRHFISAGSDSLWTLGKYLGQGYVQIGGAVPPGVSGAPWTSTDGPRTLGWTCCVRRS